MVGHDHQHGAGAGRATGRAGERHRRALAWSLGLVLVFLVVQVATGLWTESLALLSDAGHMATDALGLAMALAAIHLASRGRRRSSATFGLYRLEILAAAANAVLLFGVGAYVLVEAARRLAEPVEVPSLPVFGVGLLGLAVNVGAVQLLRAGAEQSINLEGAYLEVLADLLGSIGVVAGAVVIWLTGWGWVDPVVGAAIGVFILPRAWRLGREALRILLQHAPEGADLERINDDLAAIDGVLDVHDLHLWTLTSDMEVLTAHLVTTESTSSHSVLDRAREVLADRHRIRHATLQVEPESHRGCDELDW